MENPFLAFDLSSWLDSRFRAQLPNKSPARKAAFSEFAHPLTRYRDIVTIIQTRASPSRVYRKSSRSMVLSPELLFPAWTRLLSRTKRAINKIPIARIRAAIRATSLRSKFVDPERSVGDDGEQPNAECPWIIERERGRASETTWLLLTNAIWSANGASRAVICSLDVCGKKEKRTGKQSANRIGCATPESNAPSISVGSIFTFAGR